MWFCYSGMLQQVFNKARVQWQKQLRVWVNEAIVWFACGFSHFAYSLTISATSHCRQKSRLQSQSKENRFWCERERWWFAPQMLLPNLKQLQLLETNWHRLLQHNVHHCTPEMIQMHCLYKYIITMKFWLTTWQFFVVHHACVFTNTAKCNTKVLYRLLGPMWMYKYSY